MTAKAAPPTPIQNTIPSSKLESPATKRGNQESGAESHHTDVQEHCSLSQPPPNGDGPRVPAALPIFSNQGSCDPATRSMTAGLVGLCGLSCILSSFTDSFKDKDGNVCYEGSSSLPPEAAARYRLKGMDFVHGVLSLLVFAAIALFDENVVSCFYPEPSKECREVLTALPVGFGAVCSMLFVVFPTERHGIGFPISTN